MATVQETGPQLTISLFRFEPVIPTAQGRMGNRHNRALLALACREATEPRGKIAFLGVRRRPRRLTQAAPQPGTPSVRGFPDKRLPVLSWLPGPIPVVVSK